MSLDFPSCPLDSCFLAEAKASVHVFCPTTLPWPLLLFLSPLCSHCFLVISVLQYSTCPTKKNCKIIESSQQLIVICLLFELALHYVPQVFCLSFCLSSNILTHISYESYFSRWYFVSGMHNEEWNLEPSYQCNCCTFICIIHWTTGFYILNHLNERVLQIKSNLNFSFAPCAILSKIFSPVCRQ